MSEHTKEPWAIDPDDRLGMEWNNHIVSVANPDRTICFMSHDGTSENIECQANASRIVACVNACAGIPTGMLEAAGQSAVIALRPVDELVAERNALLAALEPFADIQHYSLAPDGAGFAMRSNGEAVTYGQIRAAKTVFDRVKP